jgi:hypothetical protein
MEGDCELGERRCIVLRDLAVLERVPGKLLVDPVTGRWVCDEIIQTPDKDVVYVRSGAEVFCSTRSEGRPTIHYPALPLRGTVKMKWRRLDRTEEWESWRCIPRGGLKRQT